MGNSQIRDYFDMLSDSSACLHFVAVENDILTRIRRYMCIEPNDRASIGFECIVVAISSLSN